MSFRLNIYINYKEDKISVYSLNSTDTRELVSAIDMPYNDSVAYHDLSNSMLDKIIDYFNKLIAENNEFISDNRKSADYYKSILSSADNVEVFQHIKSIIEDLNYDINLLQEEQENYKVLLAQINLVQEIKQYNKGVELVYSIG